MDKNTCGGWLGMMSWLWLQANSALKQLNFWNVRNMVEAFIWRNYYMAFWKLGRPGPEWNEHTHHKIDRFITNICYRQLITQRINISKFQLLSAHHLKMQTFAGNSWRTRTIQHNQSAQSHNDKDAPPEYTYELYKMRTCHYKHSLKSPLCVWLYVKATRESL